MRRRNVESEIRAFFERVVLRRGLEAAVTVSIGSDGQTNVTIKDHVPYLPFLRPMRERPRFVVSMKGYLSSRHFGKSYVDGAGGKLPTARGRINRNSNKERGRVAFFTLVDADGNDEELAAISFHVDDDKATPLILRDVALRVDSQQKHDLSRAAAGWLLFYVAEASRQRCGKEEVGADSGKMGDPHLLAELGFRNRPKPGGFTVSGSYIAFRPPPRGAQA